MTVTSNETMLPGSREAVITHDIFNLLITGGCPLQAASEVARRIRELEEAHIRLLGDLASVRGGRDLLVQLLKEVEKENKQLETALLLTRKKARPLMARLSQRMLLQ